MELESRSDAKKRVAPYGPVKGMVEGLQLLQRLSPSVVDEGLLRANKVAPNNEYKVIGALRFLELIDDEGRPTERSRLLKTRGATYMLNLQEIVRQAYSELFRKMSLREANRDRVHNYFVTEGRMGTEMAVKATRFFVELCRLAGFEMAAELQADQRPRVPSQRQSVSKVKRALPVRETVAPEPQPATLPVLSGFPLVMAITPELASIDEEELEQLFKRMIRAWRRAVDDRSE